MTDEHPDAGLFTSAWIAGQTPVVICKICGVMIWPDPDATHQAGVHTATHTDAEKEAVR